MSRASGKMLLESRGQLMALSRPRSDWLAAPTVSIILTQVLQHLPSDTCEFDQIVVLVYQCAYVQGNAEKYPKQPPTMSTSSQLVVVEECRHIVAKRADLVLSLVLDPVVAAACPPQAVLAREQQPGNDAATKQEDCLIAKNDSMT